MIKHTVGALRNSFRFSAHALSRKLVHNSPVARMADKVDKAELRNRLTPIQYNVTQEKGTERPFTGCYNKFYEPGTYVCIVCEQALFSSETKYDSGCGWPAFNDVLDKGKVKLTPDTSGGVFRQMWSRSRGLFSMLGFSWSYHVCASLLHHFLTETSEVPSCIAAKACGCWSV
ncbi:hypothetical protein Zmor_016196 [Zophobas morio]|uniref:peptide-methionine (R)-S-oxide reductase n=1 Tax=Zophobas morio TaxID=2755281 RepID=A0AA38ING9_9CUCU|nr:hypothetical protein Zmor_016196 [Zophobas morio]